MISERQIRILNSLVKEYIDSAEPVSSNLLKKKCGLDVSPATIRNEMQELTEQGYIKQPHTSAGRIPTEKGYRYFIEITFSGKTDRFPGFILKEIENAKEKIENELKLAQKLTYSLEHISAILDFGRIEEDTLFDVLKIIGPAQTSHNKNIRLINGLLEELNNF
ncbi:MAG: DeoR family transcriptional regulator [Candidatus Staskawiczbacteria bacterium]|nr:DeoR family transcriptional regulator [Candidatus Staskawiczbacteria bacterium]